MATPNSNREMTNTSYYLQDVWNVTKAFNLTGGIRYTRHSKAGNNTSLSATAGYNINDKTNIYASAKKYFIVPN